MLGAIGLDAGQESAYRALVALGAAEVADLAHRLALPETDTERALRRLEQQGLASRSSAWKGRWVAAPPGVALGALLTQQRRQLERAELAAASLAQEYRAEAEGPAVHDLVEVVTGASAVAHRFAQVRLGAVVEVCALLTEVSQGEAVQPRPGVAHRVVIERETLAASPSAAAPPRGAQLRVADRVPGGLLVADRRLGIVPLTARGSEPAALVVHGCGLLDSLLGLFEAVWREALPLRLAGGGAPGPAGTPGAAGAAGGGYEEVTTGPDATDLEILSLLLAGMTDARVAKRLDLGLRTVQRRVKGLMELAGVTTRLQLGWHAYAKGWVAREPLG